MSESVNLPALGESVTEGTVTRWLKSVGDRVEVDEPLLEVSTDKVDTEIPSPVAGVIEEILVAEDETVDVGTALVRIGDGSGDAAPAEGDSAQTPQPEQEAQPAADAAPAADPTVTPGPTEGPEDEHPAAVPAPVSASTQPGGYETPSPEQESTGQPEAVAEVPSSAAPEAAEAADHSAAQTVPAPAPAPAPAESAQEAAQPEPDHEAVQAPQQGPGKGGSDGGADGGSDGGSPSGAPSGYVTPIVRKLAHDRGVDLTAITGTGVGGRIRKEDVLAAGDAFTDTAASAAPRAVAAASPLRGTTVAMSRLRKVIAERAVVSLQSSAQLTSVVEVDVTRVARLRDRVKQQFLDKTGVKLSFLPFFALAAAEALRSYPIINATVEGDSIVYPDTENISIAVDTERGLLTPVVRNAGALDLAGLAAQIADLAARTRDNKLKPDELAGGTFTLTNTGSRGALFDTPLVFLPQVAILGTGIVAKKPVVVSEDGLDAIAIRSTVYLALSYDHRIVDGADAARFLVAVKSRLEEGDFEANLGI